MGHFLTPTSTPAEKKRFWAQFKMVGGFLVPKKKRKKKK